MNKVVKIKNITLYVGFTEHSAECFEAIKLLKKAGIKFSLLNYGDDEESHKANFEAISSWYLGEEGHKKQCSQFPILTYDLFYEDWTMTREVDHGLEEIKKSTIFANVDLI